MIYDITVLPKTLNSPNLEVSDLALRVSSSRKPLPDVRAGGKGLKVAGKEGAVEPHEKHTCITPLPLG